MVQSDLQPSCADEALEQPLLPSLPDEGAEHGSLQLLNIVRCEVGEVAMLGVTPDVLHGVEVWRVGGKPFHPDRAGVLAEPPRDADCSMCPAPIPDEGEAPWEVAVEVAKELEDVRRPHVVVVIGPVQPDTPPARRYREGADRG